MMQETKTRKQLELADLREHLAKEDGQQYWRSLDELAQTDEFADLVQREFPEQADELKDPVTRRNFLKLMGASFALGGLSACTIQPQEKIVPQVRAPEEIVPGKPLYYATAYIQHGVGTGVLVESHMGRPTKIEGNPLHPASLGGTSGVVQASILDLYDPDRSQTVKNGGRLSTWSTFLDNFMQQLGLQNIKEGAGLRILTQSITSPTQGYLLSEIKKQYPQSKWHQYEAVNRDHFHAGSIAAYSQHVSTVYDFAKANVILSLDSDFANSGEASARYARDFASNRRIRDGKKAMNRLYVIESSPTATGSMADHRLAMGTPAIELTVLQIAAALGIQVSGATASGTPSDWVQAVVKDLQANKGRSIVTAGNSLSPGVHALVHAINEKLGNVGATVHLTAPYEVAPVSHVESIRDLVGDMNSGKVDLLVILGGNPVYDAPRDLGFAQAMEKVAARVHMGLSENETSDTCHWHVPESHYLESWGDVRAYNGLATIVQPLIEPLYKAHSAYELLGAMAGKAGTSALDLVREYWESQGLTVNFATYWRRALHDGILPGTESASLTLNIRSTIELQPGFAQLPEEDDIELQLRPDPMILDGSKANNGWLQETPRPVTKLTWDNAALVSPSTAQRLRLQSERLAELRIGEASLSVPVWIVPGQADNVVTLHTGYGRTRGGRVAAGSGFDAYELSTSEQPHGGQGLQITGSYDRYPLACTQEHHSMEGRQLVRESSLENYKHHPHFAHEGWYAHDPPEDLTLYNRTDHQYDGYAWGMVIDLTACMGCNACALACQAENNIPVVGKDQVLNGREMAWIRIDRYYKGELDTPGIVHQPVPCMQCENAPCEVVCPVAATVHSAEGLNDMVYNRCVGTRYCANNCPYKVRRFNFLLYTDKETESLKLQRNPDVTVRSRGIMEKCTYCVQRINQVRIEAKTSGNDIEDGQIVTACEQACPTEAIVFGNINDPESRVSRYKATELNYGILTDLNTRPRTTYLAALKNPNPEIVEN
jgi:molybdopterin-containing oxidoreductase family iron-sulfur binding subunit